MKDTFLTVNTFTVKIVFDDMREEYAYLVYDPESMKIALFGSDKKYRSRNAAITAVKKALNGLELSMFQN